MPPWRSALRAPARHCATFVSWLSSADLFVGQNAHSAYDNAAMTSLLFAFAIGLMIPIQAAVNNQLKAYVGASTLLAAFVSFSVGTLALALVATVNREPWAALGDMPKAQWWHLTGGL